MWFRARLDIKSLMAPSKLVPAAIRRHIRRGGLHVLSRGRRRQACMEKVEGVERPDWKDRAEAAGFVFHTMHG